MTKLYATNIDWDTDGYQVALPSEVELPSDMTDAEAIDMEGADYLSNKYGYCVNTFNITRK
jgi:hypothetical protein